MATYFGICDSDGTLKVDDPKDYDDVGAIVTFWHTESFTCPGSGNQNIQCLQAYGYQTAAVNIRLAVYDSTGATLIAEGTGEVAVSGSQGWQGHATQASVKAAGGASPGVLVGGTSYILAGSVDKAGSGIRWARGYDDLTVKDKLADYTGGFPAALPAPDESPGECYIMRCGVDAAAGGRTTKNTDCCSLGTAFGMAFGMKRYR